MKKLNLRNKTKRWLATALATTLLASLAVQPVYADTISKVSIKLNIDLEDGEKLPSLDWDNDGDADAEVSIASSNRYEIVKAEWSKDEDEVKMGETYKLKVTLEGVDDYTFSSSYSSSKVTVKGGEYVSARRNDADQLVVTLRTNKVEGVLEVPDDARWLSENSKNAKFGYAKWDSVDDAAYDVQLYRNDKSVQRITGIKSTSIDLYPYMTKEGDYTFRVRAVPKNEKVEEYAKGSEWTYSDELYVDEDEVSDGTTQSPAIEDASELDEVTQVGWIENNGKWFFRYPDGSYLRNSWGKINGLWYLFDNSGEMLTDWQKRNNVYYYMNSDGAMQTGWLLYNDTWYFLNPDGGMATGWISVNGQTYYMETSGAMATGWTQIGGQYYYFYPDGHKAVNEVISGFYVDMNGIWQRP